MCLLQKQLIRCTMRRAHRANGTDGAHRLRWRRAASAREGKVSRAVKPKLQVGRLVQVGLFLCMLRLPGVQTALAQRVLVVSRQLHSAQLTCNSQRALR